MNGSTLSDDLMRLTLLFGTMAFFAMSGLAYFSGSTPEWVVLKGSIGFASVGLIGWVFSLVIHAKDVGDSGDSGRLGSKIDVTLPESAPASEPKHSAGEKKPDELSSG